MYQLLELKEKVRILYNGYSFYVDTVLKFVLAMVSMIVINMNIGTLGVLKNPLTMIIIALICGFLPKTLVSVLMILVMVANICSISIEMGAFVLIVFFIMYLLFFRFSPKESIVLLAVPILFFLKAPFIMPILIGLVGTPASVVSMSFGTIIYFILSYIGTNYDKVVEVASADGMQALSTLALEVFKKPVMYFCIAVFAVVVLVVYIIRRLSIDYSWIAAIVTGGVISLVSFIIGNIIFDMSLAMGMAGSVISSVLCTALMWFLHFFIRSVDYTRSEKVQFEDDEYYYYVKAVPKVKVMAPDVNIRRVNAKNVKNSNRK